MRHPRLRAVYVADCPIDHRLTAIHLLKYRPRCGMMDKCESVKPQRVAQASNSARDNIVEGRQTEVCRTLQMNRAVFMDRDGTISEELAT
jgi:hypothetical protein